MLPQLRWLAQNFRRKDMQLTRSLNDERLISNHPSSRSSQSYFSELGRQCTGTYIITGWCCELRGGHELDMERGFNSKTCFVNKKKQYLLQWRGGSGAGLACGEGDVVGRRGSDGSRSVDSRSGLKEYGCRGSPASPPFRNSSKLRKSSVPPVAPNPGLGPRAFIPACWGGCAG